MIGANSSNSVTSTPKLSNVSGGGNSHISPVIIINILATISSNDIMAMNNGRSAIVMQRCVRE